MAFNWEEYLILAEELMGQQSKPACSEAKARCSLSRAYYAAYSVAFDYLVGQGELTPKSGQAYHTVVIQKFGKLSRREATKSTPRSVTCNDIASYLGDLLPKRVQADYHNPLQITDLSTTVEWQLLNAHEVISLVRSL